MRAKQTLARQTGLISRSQALAEGMSPSAITRNLKSGEWQPVLPGVYRHLASPVSDSLMVHAASLWLPGSAVLWGAWAAWWFELRAAPDSPVSMTVPRSHNGRSHKYVKLRRRDLSPADVIVHEGVRVTTKALTTLENARLDGGRATFDRSLQKHLKPTDLIEPAQRLWHAYGVVAAKEAMALASDGTVSHPERTFAAALRGAGLTTVRAGVKVRIGGSLFWLDFAVVEIKLAIEIDGRAAHMTPEVFENDRRRQNALILAGWTVLRYTAWQIRHDMSTVLLETRAALSISA